MRIRNNLTRELFSTGDPLTSTSFLRCRWGRLVISRKIYIETQMTWKWFKEQPGCNYISRQRGSRDILTGPIRMTTETMQALLFHVSSKMSSVCFDFTFMTRTLGMYGNITNLTWWANRIENIYEPIKMPYMNIDDQSYLIYRAK